MTKSKYYVRVTPTHEPKLLEYLKTYDIEHDLLSLDMANGEASCLYMLNMESEEALSMKLSITLKGYL